MSHSDFASDQIACTRARWPRALAFTLVSPPGGVADDRLQFTGTTLSGAPFNGELVGKPAVLWFLEPVVPVLQRGAQASGRRGGQSQGHLRRRRGPLRRRGMQGFVSKYNLNFTNLNDADASIWARTTSRGTAYVFYRADGSSTL